MVACSFSYSGLGVTCENHGSTLVMRSKDLRISKNKKSYASGVWDPSTIGTITKIESLQRRATKFILNTHWQEDISYHERLSRLNLLPLTYWHEVKDLNFLSRWPLHVTHVDDYVKPKGTRLSQVPHKALTI